MHAFENPGIRVTWSKARCIHFAACVRGLPNVFQPGERPWVQLDGAPAVNVAEIVMRCPTGALHFEPLGGVAPEPPPGSNTIQVSRGGPLFVRGRIQIESESGEVVLEDVRMALCRCGGSGNKPFCDGTHFRVGFGDPGDVFEGGLKAGESADPKLHVTPTTGGPLRIRGSVTLSSADGRVVLEGGACNLCRCGASRNKPFCDGSHATLTSGAAAAP